MPAIPYSRQHGAETCVGNALASNAMLMCHNAIKHRAAPELRAACARGGQPGAWGPHALPATAAGTL